MKNENVRSEEPCPKSTYPICWGKHENTSYHVFNHGIL